MTNDSLARDYLVRSRTKLKVLDLLMAEAAWPDVVREAQEIVELCLKGMLRQAGIDPPRWHDVGQTLQDNRDRFPAPVAANLDRLAEISAWLRKEREFAFYGDVDLVPSENYFQADAERALIDARLVVQAAGEFIPDPA